MTYWRTDYRPELDDTTYEDWFIDMVAYYIRKQIDVDRARQLASEFMCRQYRRRSETIRCESQKDYYEARDDDWVTR